MTLEAFLTRLAQDGVACVEADPALTSGDRWAEIILRWDATQKAEFAGGAPEISLLAAEWAAVRLYRACQAVVCRDMPPQDLQRFLAEPCPEARSASVDYSVDLLFRFLPDLVQLTRRLAQNDPLVAELLVLARGWPLSSVGIPDLGEVAAPLLDAPALRQLYVDRVLATQDLSRLQHREIRSAVQIALGAYPELAPKIATALSTAP